MDLSMSFFLRNKFWKITSKRIVYWFTLHGFLNKLSLFLNVN